MKTVIIFGGSGFIGSKLIDFYLKRKFSVFSISLRKKKIKNSYENENVEKITMGGNSYIQLWLNKNVYNY